MEGKSLSVSEACGEEIQLINRKPLAVHTAFGERGQSGKEAIKAHLKSMSVWSTESEHKAHLQNRLEDTRLTTNLYQIRKQKHIAERKFIQDVRSLRIRSARLSLPGEGDTPRAATASRSTLSSQMSTNRTQNDSQSRLASGVTERTRLTRPKTAPPMMSYSQQTTATCILCTTVRNMAMKHRRMNVRTLHSTEDMTESFFLSLERHGKLPDVIQAYLDHLPYCINARTNTIPDPVPQQTSRPPVRLAASAMDTLTKPETEDASGDATNSYSDDDDDEFDIDVGAFGKTKKAVKTESKEKELDTKPTKEKVERVSIREDEEGMTITHHEEIGDVTRRFAKDSVNWRLYNFLKSQREFNTKCSVPRHIAETNEKWFFDHSSTTLHKRRISVLPNRRRSHYKK